MGDGLLRMLAANGAADDGALRRAGLRLGLRTGGGDVVEGGAALTLAFTLVTLAAAVAVGGGPARGAT